MNRTLLKTIHLKGSATDVTFSLGKVRSKQITTRIEFWNQTLAKLFKGKRDRLKALENEFYKCGVKAAPTYVDEIRAMAEGAGVAFKDLFRLNITELKPFAEKCSTLIFPIATPKGRRILIAHNEDWTPDQNDVFILSVKMPDVSYVILTYDGYLPGLSSGVNSHGVAHAVNYVLAKDIRAAIPRIFITRSLVTTPSTKEFLKWLEKTHRAFGQSIHIAEKDRYTGIEVTAKQMALRKLKLPTLHTNHYLAETLSKVRGTPSKSSLIRYKVGCELLKNAMRGLSLKDLTRASVSKIAKKILSDRSGFPYAIWRDADHPLETSATVATAFFGTDGGAVEVYRKKPDVSQPVRITLP